MLSTLLLAGLLLTQAPDTTPAQEPQPPDAPVGAGLSATTGDLVGGGLAVPQLAEADALLIENYLLRLQALQAELDKRRQAIEARIAAKYPGFRVDWQTGALVPLASPATEPEP